MEVEHDHESAQLTKRGTDYFTTRRQDVFAGLGELEKQHSAFLKVAERDGRLGAEGLVKSDPEVLDERSEGKEQRSSQRSKSTLGNLRDSDYRSEKKSSSSRRRSGSGDRDHHRDDHRFRRPLAGSRGRRSVVPDFKKHPEKYTMYSLGDVSDMSNSSNTHAAFAFLEERKLQREREERKAAGLPEDMEEERFDSGAAACSQGVITFSRRPRNTVTQRGDSKSVGKAPVLDESADTCNSVSAVNLSETDEDAHTVDTVMQTDFEKDAGPTSTNCVSEGFKSRQKRKGNRNIRRKCDSDDSD